MLKYAIIIVLSLMPAFAYANDTDCSSLRTEIQAIDKRSTKLVQDYRREVSVFGFRALMIKGTDYEDAGKNIAQIADVVNQCKSALGEKNCQYVSKEIISLISKGVFLCTVEKKQGCGIC